MKFVFWSIFPGDKRHAGSREIDQYLKLKNHEEISAIVNKSWRLQVRERRRLRDKRASMALAMAPPFADSLRELQALQPLQYLHAANLSVC